jgi:alpha-N-acetylglucosaminidase
MKHRTWNLKVIYLSVFFSLLSVIATAQSNNIKAAHALAKRIAPTFANRILFEEIKFSNDKDVYELQSKGSKLVIRGNSSNSMAVGLNYYLKNYCNTSVSWYVNDKIFLPKEMPQVKNLIHQEARIQNRFFLNYCTFGYTMPWWQWNDWEHFIDWMALNGINLPLAITGEEYVWQRVWKKFGLSDEAIRSFFTGPAFLPWHRMANIDGWDGPLPQSWLDKQMELQKKIVKRERELAMKPVLPAFSGHIPEALKTKFPNAKISHLKWVLEKQYSSSFLDPFDSLFYPIQKEFITEQTKLYGTDHIYGADLFNEMSPPSWDADYLANASKIVYNSMANADADARWLQMSWLFLNKDWTNERVQAYLRAVPQDKVILLDYFCDAVEGVEIWKQTESFFGQPYIWCYLGDFGGTTMLGGSLKGTEQRMENAFNNGGRNLWGIGSTLEGFGINPIAYECVFDKAWSNGSINVDDWVKNWATRRYGKANESVLKAWDILLNTAYDKERGTLCPLTNSRPVLKDFYKVGWGIDPTYHYDNKKLLQAWNLLNSVSGNLTDVYKYDMVVVGNQVLGNYFKDVRDEFTKAYEAKDLKQLTYFGNKMIGIINDMDELLSTNKNLLVGDWIEAAKTFAANEQEKKYYEQDARKMITVWGEKGGALTDYANRCNAGLMKDYYGERWKMFIDEITNCVKNNKEYDEKNFFNKLSDFEENWAESNNPYPSTPKGNSLEVSKKLYAKYAAEIP